MVKAIAGIKIMPTFAESKRINEYLITEVCESLTNVPFRLNKYTHNYILVLKIISYWFEKIGRFLKAISIH